ncbi:unnamed protein product, partial [Bubo scandiacus]
FHKAKGQLLEDLSKGTENLMVIPSVKVSLIEWGKMHIFIWVLSNTELNRSREMILPLYFPL